jgi:Gpi18-like mannosyltransferase
MPRRDESRMETVAFVIGMKLLLLVYGVVVMVSMRNWLAPVGVSWLELWNQWDAPHYIDIARDGYVTTGDQRFWIAFFPLFPWLVRALTVVVRDYVVSAHLLSLVCAIATALLFERLVALDFDRSIARAAVVFMFIFPTAYFFHAGYTESLFLALALGCILAARHDRWGVAALLGALASMTRVNGLLLIPVLMLEARGRFDRRWLWIPFVATGFAVFLAVNYSVWGDPFYFQKAAGEYWGKSLTWPWVGIARSARVAATEIPSRAHLFGAQELIFAGIGVVTTIWCWRRLRPSYAVWMTLNLLLVTSTTVLQSTPRYLLQCFPIFILFALVAAKRPLIGTMLTIISAAFFALFAALFVVGQWAF